MVSSMWPTKFCYLSLKDLTIFLTYPIDLICSAFVVSGGGVNIIGGPL